jgi:hypothetical protein
MALPELNLNPGRGVQAVIRARYGDPVNFFPIIGLQNSFFWSRLVTASSGFLKSPLATFFKQHWEVQWLILGRSNSQIEYFDL